MTSPSQQLPQTRIEQFLVLRAVVAFLGEREQFAWWDCSFLGSTGRKFVAITHPRADVATSVIAACEAARRVHDSRIGKGRVYHLFRLPHGTEQKLHRHTLTADASTLVAAIESKDTAMQRLEALANGSDTTPDGPIKLGDTKTLASSSIVGRLAVIYLGAFKSSKSSMPYFTVTE